MQDYEHGMPVSEGQTFLYFSADWCAPCKQFRPIVEDVLEDYPDLKQYYVDAATNAALSASFEIMSVPTIVVLVDGTETWRNTGALSDTRLKRLLDDALIPAEVVE